MYASEAEEFVVKHRETCSHFLYSYCMMALRSFLPTRKIPILLAAVVVFLLEAQLQWLQSSIIDFQKEMSAELVVVRHSDTMSFKPEAEYSRIPSGKKVPTEDDVVIIYNRVPKTASTTLMGVIYGLHARNSYHVVHVNISGNSPMMTLADQIRFAQNITNWCERRPAIFHGHMAYLSFNRMGLAQPLYINLIRQPLERLVSYYYFLRFGDMFRPHLKRSRQGDKETFDECVRKRHSDCRPEKLWMQVPYFCGQIPQCWEPGSDWALEQAKRNLVENYLVVGVTEEVEDFVAVLEASLPRIFSGATKWFKTSGKSHLRQTKSKKPLNQKTVDFFMETKVWQLEDEFYQFAYRIFQDAKKKLWSKKTGDRIVLPIRQKFWYEKIKPTRIPKHKIT